MLALIRAEWRLLLFGFLMTFWSAPGQTFLISLFSGEIRAELALSDGQFAAIYSLATLASAVVVIWSGALADRIDLKKLSLAVVCGLAIGCGLMSISYSIPLLLISLFLMRQLGQGLMFIISSTAMVRYIPQHRGKASALASIGYAVSEAIMPGLLVVLLLWGRLAAQLAGDWRGADAVHDSGDSIPVAWTESATPGLSRTTRTTTRRKQRRLSNPPMDACRSVARPLFLAVCTRSHVATVDVHRVHFPPGAPGRNQGLVAARLGHVVFTLRERLGGHQADLRAAGRPLWCDSHDPTGGVTDGYRAGHPGAGRKPVVGRRIPGADRDHGRLPVDRGGAILGRNVRHPASRRDQVAGRGGRWFSVRPCHRSSSAGKSTSVSAWISWHWPRRFTSSLPRRLPGTPASAAPGNTTRR